MIKINQPKIKQMKIDRPQFRTTFRNEIYDWLAKTIIYPAYVVCMTGFYDWIINNYSRIIGNIFIAISIVPLLLPLVTWTSWPMGFKGRELGFFASIAILLGSYSVNSSKTFAIFLFIISFLWMGFILRRILIDKKYKLDIFSIFWVVALLVSGFAVWYFWMFGLIRFVSASCRNIIFGFFLFFTSLWPILRIIWSLRKTKTNIFLQKPHIILTDIRAYLLWILLFISDFLLLRLIGLNLSSSIISLGILILAAGPGDLLSRLQARFRDVFKLIRVNSILNFLTKESTFSSWDFPILIKTRAFLSRNTHALLFLLVLAFGGVGMPFLAFKLQKGIEFEALLDIGGKGSILMSVIFLTFWVIRNRQKHLVFPFSVAKGQEDPYLNSMANLVTFSFVEQLRHITLLLSNRQVESISSSSGHTLPVFVTSGGDQDFVSQIQSLGKIEIGNTTFQLSDLFRLLLNSLAHTRVNGTIVKQKDNTIAIVVEFSQRGGQVISVDLAFVPETSASDLDEKIINEIAITLATKLMVKLGKHVHLASSWQNLHTFIDGLDAAYHSNWWHAIKCYRSTIEHEESLGGTSGTGYFHLGAALVFQGEVKEGYRMLSLAQARGTSQAETQYMMALALYYLGRDSLHLEPEIFDEIEMRCQEALKIKPNFPEANHLLGNSFYQKGRLNERGLTLRIHENYISNSEPQIYKNYYMMAAHYLKLALEGYDKVIRSLPKDPIAKSTIFNESANLIHYRMAATHKLGDALRGMGYYMEGITYYQDVLAAFPASTRTLVDMAKTYCYSENWQQADRFIQKKILSGDRNRWHKSVNFYRGWTIIGGILDQLSFSSKGLDLILNMYFKGQQYFHRVFATAEINKSVLGKQKNNVSQKLYKKTDEIIDADKKHHSEDLLTTTNLDENLKLLGKAVNYIDFAIYQFPRYTRHWSRVFWYDDFREVISKLANNIIINDDYRKACYESSFDNNNEYYTIQLLLWINWRIVVINSSGQTSLAEFANEIIGLNPSQDIKEIRLPENKFRQIFSDFISLQKRLEVLIRTSDIDRTIGGFEQQYELMYLARDAFNQWHVASEKLREYSFLEGKETVNFAERWVVDVFADLSVLTARILAECKAYKNLEHVSEISASFLNRWCERWKSYMPIDHFVSSRLLNFEIATLYGWLAFARLENALDKTKFTKIVLLKSLEVDSVITSGAKEAISLANKFMPNHPLCMFVSALVADINGQRERAADQLNQLMSNISASDPYKYQMRNEVLEKDNKSTQQEQNIKFDELDMQLYYQERVLGRLQFDNIIGRTQIQLKLGEIAEATGDLDAASGHFLSALASTSYKDIQVDILLKLAVVLTEKENFTGASSVIEEAKNRLQEISAPYSKDARALQLLVLECKLFTNMAQYSESISLVNEIFVIWNSGELISRFHQTIQKLVVAQMGERDLAKFISRHLKKFNQKLEHFALTTDLLRNEWGATSLIGIINLIQKEPVWKLIKNFKDIEKKGNIKNPNNLQALNTFDLSSLLGSQILTSFYKDLITFVVEECEIMNNLAFNHSQLDYDLESARKKAKYAIKVMTLVGKLEDKNLIPKNWQNRLAQFHDTLGWIYFVEGKQSGLKKSYEILSKSSLFYDKKSPIIYYHLARVRLAQLEHIWQEISAEDRKNANLDAISSWTISQFIREAFLYWRHSHRLDRSNSLYSRLRIVRKRIDTYRNIWEKMYDPMQSKKTSDDAESMTSQ